MNWDSIKTTISSMAPMLATALGGPLAGTAVSALQGVFGLDNASGTDEAKQAALVQAIAGATPADLLAIKKADQEYAAQMAQLGFKNVADLEAIAAGDRDSARKREESVKDNTPKILAYMITLAFFSTIVVLMLGICPVDVKEVVYMMLSTLGAAFTAVVCYYYGSTAGSKEKTNLIAKAPAVK